MPLKDLLPALGDAPAEVKRVAEGLPYRDFLTVCLLVDKLNLKNQTNIPTLGNVVPDCWIYVQDTSVQMGRISDLQQLVIVYVESPRAQRVN